MMSPIDINVNNVPRPRITMTAYDSSPDSSPRGSPNGNSSAGVPIKVGNVMAVYNTSGRTLRVPVVLKVYASRFEHYAVVSQDNAICRDRGFINLKHCTVQSEGNNSYTHPAERPAEVEGRLCSCGQDNANGNVRITKSSQSIKYSSAFSSKSLRSPSPPPCHRRAHSPSPLSSSPSSSSSSKDSRNNNTFRIIPNNADGHMLTFNVASLTELEQWLSVLQRSSTAVEGSDSLSCSPPTVVLCGSPLRSSLRDRSPNFRMASPQLNKRGLMPSLEEEE